MLEKTTQTIQLLKSAIDMRGGVSPSPFTNWLSPVVKNVGYGSLTFEYEVRKEMTNPEGILHGGVISAIMDDMMGATVFSMEKGRYVTVNLQVNYFAPARVGDVIQAQSLLIKEGQKVISVECELWLVEKNKMIAKASSNLLRS
jgi:uncharacterized protein (TIGR00369 family)